MSSARVCAQLFLGSLLLLALSGLLLLRPRIGLVRSGRLGSSSNDRRSSSSSSRGLDLRHSDSMSDVEWRACVRDAADVGSGLRRSSGARRPLLLYAWHPVDRFLFAGGSSSSNIGSNGGGGGGGSGGSAECDEELLLVTQLGAGARCWAALDGVLFHPPSAAERRDALPFALDAHHARVLLLTESATLWADELDAIRRQYGVDLEWTYR